MAILDIPNLPPLAPLASEGNRPAQAYSQSAPTALRVLILNLMPLKEQTERQLLRRLMAAGPLVSVTFLTTESYHSTHVSPEHLRQFYQTFSQVQDQEWDGLIITGAPVEDMAFEEVAYWPELTKIMDWSAQHVRSVLHICWGAQAGLYYHYGITKQKLPAKQFGIFSHQVLADSPLTRGMASPFLAPHSRHTYTPEPEVAKVPALQLVAQSPQAGVYLVVDEAKRWIYVTGHSEYEADTLKQEYERDKAKGLPIAIPYQYFPGNDPSKPPVCTWQRHSEMLFHNWLSFYVSGAMPNAGA